MLHICFLLKSFLIRPKMECGELTKKLTGGGPL
jgi:hypothetical protein